MINKSTNNNSLQGALNTLASHIKKSIEKSLPVRVTKVNADRTRVDVQPLVKIITDNGEELSRDEIKGIPVVTHGSSSAFISFSISVGSLGWIDSCDRDISLFLQDYADSIPPTARMHSFSDARFIPDAMRNFIINSEDSNALVISTTDGTNRIAIDNTGIRGTSTSDILFNGATITAAGDVVTSSGVSLDELKAYVEEHEHLPGTLTDSLNAPVTGATGVPIQEEA